MNTKAEFSFQPKPKAEIKVIGVGGGGGNAVNHMFKQGIRDVDFIICNTDAQALEASPINTRVQLGASLTEGRGAGNKPEVGKQAAIENIDDVKNALTENTKMVFITAGMGGGTGTGGAPIIAKTCNELGYLTVGIVTIPFRTEGKRRIKQAIEGISELEEYVDSLLVINNERIREMYGDLSVSQAFAKADNILAIAAKGIAEIITIHSQVNVDFSDVETVMRKSGLAVMGTGIATGERRAEEAVEIALNSPLLNNNDIRGAKNILLNISSGKKEVTMDEIGRIQDYLQNMAGFDADIIWGNGIDQTLEDEISVTIVATGFSYSSIPEIKAARTIEKQTVNISDSSFKEEKNIYKSNAETKTPPTNQKSFEFGAKKTNLNDDPEFESLYPTTSRERSKIKPGNVIDLSNIGDEDLEEIENIPAFKRRQLRMNDPRFQKKEYSNYAVSSDNTLTHKNSFFTKKVD